MRSFTEYFEETYPKEARDLFKASEWFKNYELGCESPLADFDCMFPRQHPFRAVLFKTLTKEELVGEALLAAGILDQSLEDLVTSGIFTTKEEGRKVFKEPLLSGHRNMPLLEKIFETLTEKTREKERQSIALVD